MFDTHAHYNNDRYDAEYEGGVSAMLDYVYANGVTHIVNVGWDIESSKLASRQALEYPGRMFAAAGMHPSDAQKVHRFDASLAELDELISNRRELGIVALGEIGLDYHYDDTDRIKQRVMFDKQMAIAKKHGVPVIIHDRDAHADSLAMIRKYPEVTCVLHSFSGSAEMAKEAVALGCYISFSGTVSFKNAPKVRAAAAVVPKDRLLMETDCPYLAPHPHRGEMNHSGLMRFTLEALAAARGETPEETERITTENALRFFGIEEIKR
ncbi:MAG: TatD family deoxyribonuclease [Ruminococcaceae bacterium]|nr:TatD family deoxyribonuclease [Oscillospiraceae bacterium]